MCPLAENLQHQKKLGINFSVYIYIFSVKSITIGKFRKIYSNTLKIFRGQRWHQTLTLHVYPWNLKFSWAGYPEVTWPRSRDRDPALRRDAAVEQPQKSSPTGHWSQKSSRGTSILSRWSHGVASSRPGTPAATWIWHQIQEQQAYLRMVIDVHLENKIFVDIQEDTPIFGMETQVSCMRILEEEFLTRYPLVTRQMEFFESRQQKDQLYSDWSSQLRALGDQASLNELTTVGIYIMRYLTGVADEKRREKFLKETQPAIDLLDKIAH